jgi:transcription elongation factor Elf1
MSKELKPCPFCGHKTIQESFFDLPCKVYRIRCPRCYIFMDNTSENMVMKAWNTRPIEDELQKQAERTPQEKAEPEMYSMLERILDYMTGGPFLAEPPSVEEIAHLLEEARGER